MRLNQACSVGFCLLALMLGNSAWAHRMNTAISLVEVSPTSGRLQVTHSLSAHDLEGVLGAGSVSVTWFDTPAGGAALRAYCEQKFVLNGQNNRPIVLAFIGVELNGDLINVYFEAPRYRGATVTVDANFLQEVSESQVNRVNVRARGKTVSAVFLQGTEPKLMTIPRQ
jgi:hypothetical protein